MGYRWVLAVFWVWGMGCGGDDVAQRDAGDFDSGGAGTGMQHHDAAIDSGDHDASVDGSNPVLPACNLVCDRVLDCAATSCIGIDWRAARLAQMVCDDACSPQFNSNVMAASDCNGVMQVVESNSPTFEMLCNDRPCVSACRAFATCMIQECERYATQTPEAVQAGCMDWCQDESANDIVAVSCDVLVAALSSNDPSFEAGCHGSTGCADMTACVAYADKTTGCALEHCDGHADAYEMGIQQVLVDYCATAEDCPAPESIALINGDGFTCDDPPLDVAGPAAPFTAICDGTVDGEHDNLVAACDTLITCGAEFASSELCAVFLTFDVGAATKANCIDTALDCAGAFGCL